MAIAKSIGKPIKVDTNTTVVVRGHFAKVCVEIELNQALISQFTFDGTIYKVEYEGLHTICFAYGCFRCKQDICLINVVRRLENNSSIEGQATDDDVAIERGDALDQNHYGKNENFRS